MYSPLVTMIDRLDAGRLPTATLLGWSTPVPFFGDATRARVATLGINPSDQEFLDRFGGALTGEACRLPTLASLGVSSWSDVSWVHLKQILVACRGYFQHNPYVRWFGVLEGVVSAGGASFYGRAPTACHLDLVPYATRVKWGALAANERSALLHATADILGCIIRDSSISVLILNGHSVASQFQKLIDRQLDVTEMPEWQLPRSAGQPVKGHAYTGTVKRIGGVRLEASIEVVGYNHNLQSSFGVTRGVVSSIAGWVSNAVDKAIG